MVFITSQHLSRRPSVLSCQRVRSAYNEAIIIWKACNNDRRWYLQDDPKVFQTRGNDQREKSLCYVISTSFVFAVHLFSWWAKCSFFLLHIQPINFFFRLGGVVETSAVTKPDRWHIQCITLGEVDHNSMYWDCVRTNGAVAVNCPQSKSERQRLSRHCRPLVGRAFK